MTTSPEATLIARRRAAMGPTYRLFYRDPVELVRGERVWLWDAAGRRYLDAYNNVPVVGHCHPRVVDALARQAGTLNTHTRYLGELPVRLAERLLATLPDPIGNIVFTCSGSESNDLAVRVARAATGRRGVVVTDNAYHGTTDLLWQMSPSGERPIGAETATVAPPRAGESAAAFGERVAQAIAALAERGIGVAALLIDTVLSSDGLACEPIGSLAAAHRAVHEAGGLFIADEVQAGFGRCDGMWGFARHGIVPDIVTTGKPMGNGHPLAAMATSPALMAQFARGGRYFNTFGGNSVSSAVGLAVLDVIADEGLVAHAAAMGERLGRGIADAVAGDGRVRAVRRAGLFCGVEMVDGATAANLVNAMRDAGVLVSASGAGAETVKIRPPLPIRAAEVDQIVSTLAASLR